MKRTADKLLITFFASAVWLIQGNIVKNVSPSDFPFFDCMSNDDCFSTKHVHAWSSSLVVGYLMSAPRKAFEGLSSPNLDRLDVASLLQHQQLGPFPSSSF